MNFVLSLSLMTFSMFQYIFIAAAIKAISQSSDLFVVVQGSK